MRKLLYDQRLVTILSTKARGVHLRRARSFLGLARLQEPVTIMVMSTASPKFKNPPVVETVMGVQFEPLEGYADAHAGVFAVGHLDDSWREFRVQPHLDDQFERFGADRKWGPVHGLTFRQGPGPERTQIIRRDQERMVQIQDTRFIYNWKKGEGQYPSYDHLRPEFDKLFDTFGSFCEASRFGRPQLNQWEMTYVNHIPRGDLWSDLGDWSSVFRHWFWPAAEVESQASETFVGRWALCIGGNRGRLHVEIAHGRIGGADGSEAIIFKLTARGPISDETATPGEGFEIGHRAIVDSFFAMTTEKAHGYWGVEKA
jgi:uncharacterized protein (TIGR04255 family)